jgi:Transposase IS4
MDRYFTSPALFDELTRRGFRACGTVRKDRADLPPSFKTVGNSMQKGDRQYWQRGELGALAWKDRRTVYMLTTHRSPAESTPINRCITSDETHVPTAVLDYNKHKGGVDTVDQMRHSYAIGRKSKKWWPQLVWWLIDMCILNAYRLYNEQQRVKIRRLEFREQLMRQLVEQYGQQRNHIGRPSPTSHQHQQEGHWPQRTNEKRDCVYCSVRADQRHESRMRCELCQVHLCIDCFKLYHQARN